jgi:pimeloyl-ACP methyl ester carboxylesterase
MQRTEEQMAALPNGISLCYDTFGDPSDPAALLVMGLSGQMIWWSPQLCELLASRGFFVVRFDNRDIGRSSKVPGPPIRRSDTIRSVLRGGRSAPPYTLSDMAGDAVGLLDHLEISAAHVIGVSMGGMIAQTLAIEHPDRVLSLVSIMSTTGRRTVGWPDPRLLPLFFRKGSSDIESFVEDFFLVFETIGSPGFPASREEGRALAEATYARGLSPEGAARQLQAILTQPDRTRALHDLRVPTLVVHGLNDRLVHVSGGRATAAAIPGAELLLIRGMGHDLPTAVWPEIVSAITRNAHRALR